MAVPRDPDARRYYRAAGQRLDDARAVLGIGRTTASVYLAGYCVECLLKALILANLPAARRIRVMPELMTHNFEALLRLYAEQCGGTIPDEVREDLSAIASWAPRLRYDPGTISGRVAREFLAAVTRIRDWADGRL